MESYFKLGTTAADYSSKQLENINTIRQQGKEEINKAADGQAVTAALRKALEEINKVTETTEKVVEKNVQAVKNEAIKKLNTYFKSGTKAADYKGDQLTMIGELRVQGTKAINAAQTASAVNDALLQVLEELDTVDTTKEAEQKAEELQAAKTETVTKLESYFTSGTTAADYSDVQLERIRSIKQSWIEAINAAEDGTVITDALSKALEEVDNARKQEWKKGLFIICILLVISVIYIVILCIN